MQRMCCAECFGDRGLRNNIIPSLSTVTGKCGFCESDNVALVEPKMLADYFEILISIYDQDSNGLTLVELLKKDWRLFSHDCMDDPHAKDLLGEVLDDGNVVRKKFKPSSLYESKGLVQWETLRDELLNKNRYFLDEDFDSLRLEELLPYLVSDELPENWYRARIMEDETPFSADKMGAPPNKLASHGRANPVGIPYLYVGSNTATAISEVRPHPGEKVCVAEFYIPNTLTIIDLRNPRAQVSPFLLADASAIGQLRADIPFLEKLGDELTRPVLPRSAAIEYIPSQYLCEFIKKSGYAGVLYRSSLDEGMNLSLFNPQSSLIGNVTVHHVKNVDVNSEPAL